MSYAHLTEQERYVIAHMRIAKFSLRQIGDRVSRHPSTISRELKRNGPPEGADWPYWYDAAQSRADERRYNARHHFRQDNPQLLDYVEKKIRLDWSPEQISAKLVLDYPDNQAMRVSIETIYRWIYLDARVGGQLYKHLRRRRKYRRRQKRYGAGRRFVAGRVGIEARPEGVEERRRFGDWEGDTVVGKRGRSNIVTHVERKSRYLMAARLEDRKAETFAAKSIELFETIAPELRKTLTLDNGSECARFDKIEKESGLNVYFAAPYAAWQRGANENTNGLLRQYFPKGTDFKKVKDEKLQKAVSRLNHRPRKCLNYRTPHEVFMEAQNVALAK
ncbi:MAG: IS30 family transposase [Proteobacteria bacterium]|nr:IS30 family transposase [Pseudomonadota bacterium]